MTTLPAAPITENVPLTEDESQKISAATIGADKIVVAIHGIGDQYRNATIQTVVSAFGRFARYPAARPLGFFHDASSTVRAFQLTGPPDPDANLGAIGFVEVYWADIPRAAQTEGYIIEETKAWARTVVERVRARFGVCAGELKAKGPNNECLELRLGQHDYFAGADVIEEMIETFKVLDNLLFLAEKAGVVKFDLNYLLTQYVGDVQLVADFANYRNNILDNFRQVLDKVYEGNKTAEIYVVAHSEGTVVAFMGLLEAMCGTVRANNCVACEEPPGWVKQLRGFMTFGSPIDKHLILWPDIWDSLQAPHPSLAVMRGANGTAKIRWRNYYDYGDPIGFKLDTARNWMEVHNWSPFFEFTAKHDYGFGRYLLPGAAHNDYWRDDAVFGHFIHTVMDLPVPDGGGSFDEAPVDKWLHRLGANIIPYLLVLGILYVGVYLIFKGLLPYTDPKSSLGVGDLVRNIIGITALLAGMIVLARIPRLTRAPKLSTLAFAVFAAGAAVYGVLVDSEIHRFHALDLLPRGDISAAFVILLAAAVAGFAAWASRLKVREWTTGFLAAVRPFFVGTRPLILPGALCVLAVIIYAARNGGRALWPLVLASAAFIYLWWLAILIFDLVFVWHRYIRFSVAQNYLFALRKDYKKRRATGH